MSEIDLRVLVGTGIGSGGFLGERRFWVEKFESFCVLYLYEKFFERRNREFLGRLLEMDFFF